MNLCLCAYCCVIADGMQSLICADAYASERGHPPPCGRTEWPQRSCTRAYLGRCVSGRPEQCMSGLDPSEQGGLREQQVLIS